MSNSIKLQLFKSELFTCTTISQMFDVIKKYYDVYRCNVGAITKSLIISGVNNAFNKNTPIEAVNQMRSIDNLGDIIDFFEKSYSDAKIEASKKNKVIEGFESVIKMTSCKLK
ncbi:hypothetical protein [Flavobacterium sp.]|uniref:hypothetical protein n=1 Tax=Flavobacterium sp. TaxID=239 RepID=UPI002B4B12C8|nr:hypothetical protein [Flavobacterium sp.]HLF52326.1 hypothetical protein [Flavobacterium sp.]